MDKVIYVSDLSQIPQNGKIILDFFADWCGPCKKLGPVFSELSNQYSNITFIKIDTDSAEELAKHYNVSALPTVIYINNGEVVSIIKGFNMDKIKSETEELNNLP
jgi:thioredoxin 1